MFYSVFTVLVATTILLESASAATHLHSNHSIRAQGLTLNDWCAVGANAAFEYPCLLPGSFCQPNTDVSEGRGICKCKTTPLFEEAGTPADHCIPTAKVSFAEAECDSNEDCIRLVNTVCRTGPPPANKRTCGCKDDFEPDSSLTPAGTQGCKAATCTGKDGTWCAKADRAGSIAGSTCNQQTGKCVCGVGQSLITGSNGNSACVDPANIACSVATPCPLLSSGATSCVPATGATGTGKCYCQTAAGVAGTIKFGSSGLECAANTIGSTCYRKEECPTTVSCLKKSVGDNIKGICGCAAFQLPRLDNTKCDSTLGRCCKNTRDCGLGPSPANAIEKPFACIKGSYTDSTGHCGCPDGFAWDGMTCKVPASPGTCPVIN